MSTQAVAARSSTRSWGSRLGRRGRVVVVLLPLAMGAMVAIDTVLGSSAEYFNAAELLHAWGDVLRGDGVQHTFIMGQDGLGDAAALGLGSAVFVLEPAIVLSVLVFGGAGLARVLRRRRSR